MRPREDIDRIIANLEAAHGECNDACNCFHRLAAALEGDPDPDGVSYEWPLLRYGCAEPPAYGCDTPMEHAVKTIRERVAEDMYRSCLILAGCAS